MSTPHKWVVVELVCIGWGVKGAMFRTKVLSRHKTEVAAKSRCPAGATVRRLQAQKAAS